jgi:hypothetical protein
MIIPHFFDWSLDFSPPDFSPRHKSRYIKFLKVIIHKQQVSRTKIRIHHVSRKKKHATSFIEEKYHGKLSFTKE